MNSKIPIPTTLKFLDTWLNYIKSSGYGVRELLEGGGDTTTYMSDDAPGYGKTTPLATVFRDKDNRPSVWIYVRLPLNEDKEEELDYPETFNSLYDSNLALTHLGSGTKAQIERLLDVIFSMNRDINPREISELITGIATNQAAKQIVLWRRAREAEDD